MTGSILFQANTIDWKTNEHSNHNLQTSCLKNRRKRTFKNDERLIGVLSIICFIIALVFFVLFVMSDKPEFSATVVNNEGLWQRLNLVFMYLPFVIAAVIREVPSALNFH